MRHIANTEQAVAWNGYDGAHWADHAERWNTVVGEINKELFAAAAIDTRARVLDVGCGAGQTTRLAAREAGQGHATGVDLSEPMLARARATAMEEGIANVRFEQGDAQVHPFPAGEFDVAISRGGVMFFNDPVAAFANIGRALRPGGRLAFVCPQEMAANEWFVVQNSALLGHELRPSPPGAPGMFSLADPERITDVLSDAGFADVTASPVVTRMVYGSDAADAAEFFLSTGPVRFHLREAGPSEVDEARERVTAALRPYEKEGVVGLRASWWVVNATRR
ncbi:class I SAM-dependent methyltransferase [Microbispora sp. RL4-1S]|uniref:Class I SAM-dependent methyltransferase n=1 Tax=Microbispora oryzae TaxID=2806554 RepID=A0A941AL23_9ACTN|nr:class I SAM-dependent methyltransferase [Microbispora oryzae]MBP2706752.1 class I SAM-dependent methyltransferase [Microbispora oryzae]